MQLWNQLCPTDDQPETHTVCSQGFLSKNACEYVEAICNTVTSIAAAIAHTSKSSSSGNQVAAGSHRVQQPQKTAIAHFVCAITTATQQECDKRLACLAVVTGFLPQVVQKMMVKKKKKAPYCTSRHSSLGILGGYHHGNRFLTTKCISSMWVNDLT